MQPEPTAFAKPFNLTYPDGYILHGAQFPSGHCVLDDTVVGLVEAAVSLKDLTFVRDKPLVEVDWDAAEARGYQKAIDALREAGHHIAVGYLTHLATKEQNDGQ